MINKKIAVDIPVTKKHLDNAIDRAVDKLAIMIQKGFMESAKDLSELTERVKQIEQHINGHNREVQGFHQKFDAMILELREIRNEIKEADTRADVVDLQIRVAKLEKKIKIV